jgi:hypothetical protein
MGMNKDFSFSVGHEVTLTLEDLYAKVEVGVGEPNTVTVVVEGEEKVISQIKANQPSPDQVVVRGEQGGGRSSISVRGSSVEIRGSVRGSIIVSGRGNVVIGGRQIFGGDDVTVIEGDEMATVKVKAPIGTKLEIYDVEELSSRGLHGRVAVSLSGQAKANIRDAKYVRAKLNGQSQCRIENASGNVKAETNGQSGLTVSGDLMDVEADSNGQSHIAINGNCQDFTGESNGQSSISVSGRASGRIRERSCGQSHIGVR